MSDDNFYASHISHTAEAAEKDLLDILKISGIRDRCYAYKTRVKSWDKLLAKVEIKQQSKSDYDIGSVTDVLGLRVVTLFRQDMVDIVDSILALITHKESFKPNPFVANSLKEAIIYTPSMGSDPVINQVLQKIKASSLISKDMVKKSDSAARYSSIHLVAHIDRSVSEYHEKYRIPIEIQIRTVFEDAWGEIDHKYGYQSRTGKSASQIHHPIPVEKNLLTLKRFVDSCAEYADNIRDLAHGPAETTERIRALDTDPLISEKLKDLGVKASIIEEYMKIRQLRLRAEEEGGAKELYLNAAEGFNQFYSKVSNASVLDTGKSKKLFRYYLKMDEALCRLSVGGNEIPKAISIYQDLIPLYKTYPVIRFRLGQALLSANEFEQAREQLKICRKNIGRLTSFSQQDRVTYLPDQDRKRIDIGLYKMLGLAYWKEACELYMRKSTRKKAFQYFIQAYEQSKPGLDVDHITPNQRNLLINNLLFYVLEIVYLRNKANNNHEYDDEINSYVTDLSGFIDISSCTNVSQLDTLMNAYSYQKKKDEAVIVAKRLEKVAIEANLVGTVIDPEVLSRVEDLLTKLSTDKVD